MVRHQEQGLWQYVPLVVLGSLANWRGEEPGDIVPRAVSGELLRTSQFPSHRQHSMPPDLIVHPLARTQNCSVSPLHCMQRAPCSLSHYHSRWPFARSLLLSLVLSIAVCLYSVCRCAFPTFTVPLLYLSHHHCVALSRDWKYSDVRLKAQSREYKVESIESRV